METVYNLNNVMLDWTVKKLQNDEVLTSWSILPGKKGTLFLHSVDSGLEKPTRTIWLGEDMTQYQCNVNDMTLEIRCGERVAPFPTYDKVTSFDTVYKALREIPCYDQCEGTDGDGNCQTVFFIRKPCSPSYRCKNCQLQRKRNGDNKRKREKRAEERKIEEKKVKKSMKQKSDKLDKKIQSLEEDIENMRQKCSEVSSEKLEELFLMHNLPPEMQEAVKIYHLQQSKKVSEKPL